MSHYGLDKVVGHERWTLVGDLVYRSNYIFEDPNLKVV